MVRNDDPFGREPKVVGRRDNAINPAYTNMLYNNSTSNVTPNSRTYFFGVTGLMRKNLEAS